MRLKVVPGEVSGMLPASPSKSYTHRAMTIALLCRGCSVLRRVLLSEDTLATLSAVQAFGGRVRVFGDTCEIEGGQLRCPADEVDVGNSGTTLRLMAGVASLMPCRTLLTGDESIRRRPMGPLIEALEELGVRCVSTYGNSRAPLMIQGPNTGPRTHIRGDISSQFISSLLICSPLKQLDTEIILTSPIKSRPYLDMTVEMMERFGTTLEERDSGFLIPGGQSYRPTDVEIPGDFSSAAFPLVAGVLSGSCTVTDLDPNSRQGDRAIVDILRRFGAEVVIEDDRISTRRGRLTAAEVDLADTPDLFPIVAVLASQAEGESRLFGAAHLRLKESDRIRATVSMLTAMGADVEEREDGCVVRGPCQLRGAEVDSKGDHRILMAAAVAGLVAEAETIITEGGCHAVSYPQFVQDMKALGVSMEMIE